MVPADQPTRSQRPIEAVLRDHEKEFLALPHVVGAYVGRLDEGSEKLALRVMLDRDSVATRKILPKMIEGYAVVPELTGEIKPLSRSKTRAE